MIIKEINTKGILTKSNLPVSDYSVNPYVGCSHGCKYCYASFMKRFTNHPEPWGDFLDVKYWSNIKNPSRYCGKELFFGSVTDPYNPQEETYGRTHALLKQLQGSGIKLSIQTKSDLVLRDIKLIKTFPKARVGFSINTLDEQFKDDMDKAVSIERRLVAMKKLHDEGIRTTCFISPIFPGITDVTSIIDRVKNQCNLIWLENLNLRGDYKTVIMDYIRENHTELLPTYEEIYYHKSRKYWEVLDEKIRKYAGENGLEYVRDDDRMNRSFDAPPTIVNFFYHEEIKKSAKKGIKEMPEMPEVETIRRILEPQIVGRRILSVIINNSQIIAHPNEEEFVKSLIGQEILYMSRRGKFLAIHMKSGDRVVIHLRMTGQLLVTPIEYPEEKHTHLIANLSNGNQIRYIDVRRFGRFWCLKKDEEDTITGQDKLGIEPLSDSLTAEYLKSKLGNRKKAVKEMLYDQSIIAGIGNIYSDEILNEAMIYPAEKCTNLTDTDWNCIVEKIKEVITWGISTNEMTSAEYLAGKGKEYRNMSGLRVYGRNGKSCTKCKSVIEKIIIGGRTSCYCPLCQKKRTE